MLSELLALGLEALIQPCCAPIYQLGVSLASGGTQGQLPYQSPTVAIGISVEFEV